MSINAVAPLAGAWIEIKGADVLSLPLFVAPLAGAWIEITVPTLPVTSLSCRSPRGSVD